ncbi:Uncharacterized protein APZ42_003932, partial [Daphnia magna]
LGARSILLGRDAVSVPVIEEFETTKFFPLSPSEQGECLSPSKVVHSSPSKVVLSSPSKVVHSSLPFLPKRKAELSSPPSLLRCEVVHSSLRSLPRREENSLTLLFWQELEVFTREVFTLTRKRKGFKWET